MASQDVSPREAEIAKAKLASRKAHPLFRHPRKDPVVWVGNRNPKTQEELQYMDHHDFMAWLRNETRDNFIATGNRDKIDDVQVPSRDDRRRRLFGPPENT